jgi:hypothetical protein
MKHLTSPRTTVFTLLALTALLIPVAVLADAGPYLDNPIKCETAGCLFLQIIRYFLAGVAVVSTLMFIWGGFLFLTSAGNAEQVKKGKDVLLWSSIGIVVILGSWVLIRYLLEGLAGSTAVPK